ncbi:MAG: hypothetical protein JXR53_11980 [Bacteroidales bacterium]|nr:hypothetical protein [Bacteroidales bacterium]
MRRAFYEVEGYKYDDKADFPKFAKITDSDSWVEIDFCTTEEEKTTLKDEYNRADRILTAMNIFERKVGDILDKQEKILWWFRNRVNRKWYSIQGWQLHKIRPDFIAAKKTDDKHLELVYIIESKGEHLLGNIDTNYKKKVLDIMTEQKQLKNIKTYQTQIPFEEYTINDKVECYLIGQGKEEEKLKELLK